MPGTSVAKPGPLPVLHQPGNRDRHGGDPRELSSTAGLWIWSRGAHPASRARRASRACKSASFPNRRVALPALRSEASAPRHSVLGDDPLPRRRRTSPAPKHESPRHRAMSEVRRSVATRPADSAASSRGIHVSRETLPSPLVGGGAPNPPPPGDAHPDR